MARYQILYWQDIPAQLRAFDGAKPINRPLPPVFQEEIDRLAMEEGLFGTDDYLEQWRWSEKRERPGTAAEVLDALEREIRKQFDHLDK
jgi:hypothetical protein